MLCFSAERKTGTIVSTPGRPGRPPGGDYNVLWAIITSWRRYYTTHIKPAVSHKRCGRSCCGVQTVKNVLLNSKHFFICDQKIDVNANIQRWESFHWLDASTQWDKVRRNACPKHFWKSAADWASHKPRPAHNWNRNRNGNCRNWCRTRQCHPFSTPVHHPFRTAHRMPPFRCCSSRWNPSPFPAAFRMDVPVAPIRFQWNFAHQQSRCAF